MEDGLLTDSLIRERGLDRWWQAEHKEDACHDECRDWGDASVSQGMPSASKSPKARRAVECPS